MRTFTIRTFTASGSRRPAIVVDFGETVGICSNMQARLFLRNRIELTDEVFAELVIWELPKPSPGSAHSYKYRLALVANDGCVLRYDNEAGKGDHRHIAETELDYEFVDVPTLLNDFKTDILKWMKDNG